MYVRHNAYDLLHWLRSSTGHYAGFGVLAILLLTASYCWGQSGEFKITQPTPGGIDPHPYLTSISGNQDLLIKWFGFGGPYQLETKTALGAGAWSNLGNPTSESMTTVTRPGDIGFIRVQSPLAPYVAGGTCAECHPGTHNGWAKTRHAHAFQTLKDINQHNNAECLACHSVGFGVTGGFVSELATPGLSNVQCENCHGPAGGHVEWADSGIPPKVVPVITRSALLCGGCHNGFHHPTLDEWSSSPHSVVVDFLATEFSSSDRVAATGRMNACGACHSGAVRLEMLDAYAENTGNARTNVAWPSGFDAANTPTTCVVCHDTHSTHTYTNAITGLVYTNQLRNPLSSTNDFSYSTSISFALQYNPSISICGQCHNARGASVSSTSRPPHHSPQYNILIGAIGVTTNSAPPQGEHRAASRQCAACHTHRHNEDAPAPEDPVYTGHGFRPTIPACQECHTEETGPLSATNLLFTVQAEISGRVTTIKNLLDLWATTKNTAPWASKYEALGWEYTNPGQLSNPTASGSVAGPDSTEQADIPQGIKDARFNLYLVEHDGSKGIHNAPYARYLLDVAEQKVSAQLSAQ